MTSEKPQAPNRQQLRSQAVGRDGYVRVHPSWSGSRQVHMGDAPGIGRQIGWLLGAMIGAPIMLSIGRDLAFWQILLGIAISSVIGAAIAHVVFGLVWSRIKREVPATNPRTVAARDLKVGDWMMTQDDGTNRAMRVEVAPESIPDPLADSREPQETVRLRTSTGRALILPAAQDVTVVDLPKGTEPRTR